MSAPDDREAALAMEMLRLLTPLVERRPVADVAGAAAILCLTIIGEIEPAALRGAVLRAMAADCDRWAAEIEIDQLAETLR